MGSIYKITNKKNGKAYIGKTTRDGKTRIQEHLKATSKSSTLLARAVRKHGEENFTWEILHDGIIPELLDSYEIEAIKIHNTLSPTGYNLTEGGTGGIPAKEVCQKMSESRKGQSAWNKGISPSEETKKKISVAMQGENNHFYGKNHTKEAKEKMSIAHTGKIISKESRDRMSESQKKRPPRTAETCEKLSRSLQGRKFSKEHCENISIAKRGQPSTGMLGKKHKPESIEQISIAKKGKSWGNHRPESCEKISKALQTPERKSTHKLYLSLPPALNLKEKRARLRELTGYSVQKIWRWVKAWERGET